MSIPFPFTALPKSLCTQEFFQDPQLLCFYVWVFSRVAYSRRIMPFNSTTLVIERGEFMFGRKKCSEEIGLSEQTIRTYIKRLIHLGLIVKVANKSTNKCTVYRVSLEQFGEIANQQNNQELTSSQPAIHHKQEKEEKIKASKPHVFQMGDQCFPIQLSVQAKTLFQKLRLEEQKALITFFEIRNRQKKIENLSSWVVRCIQEKWYSTQMEVSQDPLKHSENNRQFAEEVAVKIGDTLGISCCARNDWFEIGKAGSRCAQIFYYEMEKEFQWKMECALREFEIDLYPS